MILKEVEFFGTPDGEVEVRMKSESFQLITSNRKFIGSFIEVLKSKKRIAYERLKKRYIKSKDNTHYYEFLIVRGYIKCNFIPLDNVLDIDENGNFNTEFILCPLTGECPDCGYICNSPDDTILTEREIEVLRNIAIGYTNSEIADIMYISVNTVHNHRNSILKKLCKNNTAELVRYWYESGLNK